MDLVNHRESDCNLNNRHKHDCYCAESSDEEIPLRPPRKSKQGSENRFAKQGKEQILLNDLRSSFTDANQNEKSESRSGINCNYRRSNSEEFKLNCRRISSNETHISTPDVECRTSTLVDCNSVAQSDAIENRYNLERDSCNKESCGLTFSATGTITLPVYDTDFTELHLVSESDQEKMNDNFSNRSRLKDDSSLLNVGESDEDSFCSLESGEEIVGVDKSDQTNKTPVWNGLESSECEPVATSFSFSEKKQPQEKKEAKSMNIGEEGTHKKEIRESHLHEFTYAGGFSVSRVAAGDNQQQNSPTQRRNIPEDKSAETADQVTQKNTSELYCRLKTDVANSDTESYIIKSKSVSDRETSRTREDSLQDVATASNGIAHMLCKSEDKQFQKFKNKSTEPKNTAQGGSDSSDSESSYSSSEGDYDINYEEVFCDIDVVQLFNNGSNTPLEDDNSTSRKLDTVVEILSAFKHTEYLSTDERPGELTALVTSTSNTKNVGDETETNTDKPAGERDFEKDKVTENTDSSLSTQSNTPNTTETREDFTNGNNSKLNNKIAENKKLSATLNGEDFERHAGICQWKYKDGALKSPVETIPEEAEDIDSRNPSRAGSQYFDINQLNFSQADTRTKASVKEDRSELQTLLYKTREKLLTDSSFRDLVSSSTEAPTSNSRTPITSLSSNSSQSDEVFDTYFGAEEKTVSSPVNKRKSAELEIFENHFGREVQTARSEPSLFSQGLGDTDQIVIRRTESSNLHSPAFRRRTAGFSQKRKGNCAKEEFCVSESPSNKTKDFCNDSKERELESSQTSNNQSRNEENVSRSVFYRSLSFSGESAVNFNDDEKQTDGSSSETSCQFASYRNMDNSSLESATQKQITVLGKTEQKTVSMVSDANRNGVLTAKSLTKDPVRTDKISNSNIANRRKTLQKMRTKYVTSYDIEVAKQRRLSSEVDEVDIKRIANFEETKKGNVEDDVKKNTEIESAVPTRPPRHKKALKYSSSFATSRTTERRGGNRNKSERRSSRWRTISSGVDALTTPDKWRLSIFGTTNFTIPLEAANHGPLTLVTDQIPAISASFPSDKRAQVVQELYETEITFVRILETIIEIFKKPLEEYLDSKDIETIFINVNEIFKLNKDLLFLLCERVTHWTSKQLVGDIFVIMNPRFKIYAKFCSHYDAAESLIKLRAEKRKDFEAFLNACYNDPICQPDQNLQAHLIAVVQRIPRYIMLLGRLLERTPKSHPDYPHLELATSKMTGIAEYINNQLQEFQGHKAMVELRSRLIGIKAFLTPDRWRIKEGEVSLMSPKKCYKLLLFNDLLVFVAKGATKQCEVELTMDLKTVWFSDLADRDPQTTKRDAFELYNPERSYTVYCGTRNEKRNWLQKLRNATAMRLHGPEATEEHDIICRKKSGFTFKDGRIYCGPFVDGKREGQGLLAWPNRNRYQGNWEDDERNGIGEMAYNTGDKYNGEWRDDKQHGFGTMKYSSGDFYTGEWYEGQMHGKGIIEFNNQDHFEGHFVRGEIKGVGTLKCASGLRYDGHWKNSKKHGKGKLHYPNGDDYNGDFENDQKHGRGEMVYADQSTYLGEWVNDRRHSSGVYSCPDGTVYDGEWNKDLITGRGKMVYPNGDVYDGTWFMNQRFCKGILKFHHGDVYEGEFEFNLMCGKGRMQYRNAGEYEGDWKAGQRSGNGKMIFADGGVYEGEWVNNLRHGKGKMAFPNRSTYEGSWKEDKQHGSGTFTHSESNYFYEGSWRYGKKDGKGVETTLKSTYNGAWKENMRHGYGKETLDSGTVLSGHWKENRKHGKVSVELKTGDINHGVFEQMWQDGHLVDKSETVPVELPLLQHGN